jgi:hypothetical protein
MPRLWLWRLQLVSYFIQTILLFLNTPDYKEVPSCAAACSRDSHAPPTRLQFFQMWTSGFGLEASSAGGSTDSLLCPFHIQPMSSVLLPATFMLLPLGILLALFWINLAWWTLQTCFTTRDRYGDTLEDPRKWWTTTRGFGWKPFARTAACECRRHACPASADSCRRGCAQTLPFWPVFLFLPHAFAVLHPDDALRLPLLQLPSCCRRR